MRTFTILLFFMLLISCAKFKPESKTEKNLPEKKNIIPENNIELKPGKSELKDITGDFDADGKQDTADFVQSSRNNKYGLRIAFGNGKTDYLGMGKEVIGQGFDDFDWVGIFEKIDKGRTIWSNLDENGEFIINDAEVREEDKVTLSGDGIFVHNAEACGGGIIYLKNGKYGWVQQE